MAHGEGDEERPGWVAPGGDAQATQPAIPRQWTPPRPTLPDDQWAPPRPTLPDDQWAPPRPRPPDDQWAPPDPQTPAFPPAPTYRPAPAYPQGVGYPQPGGYLHPGYPQPSAPLPSSYPQPGYPQPGSFSQPGYPQPGAQPHPAAHPHPGGYPQPLGSPVPGYPPPPGSLPPPGYPQPPGYPVPPGYPQPVGFPAPGYPATPGRRRSLTLRLSLLGAFLLVLCGTPAVWAIVTITPQLNRGATPAPPATSPAEGSTSSAPRSPQQGDPPSVRVAWIRTQVNATLGAQGRALLGGDETGFLAAGDAGNATVRAELTRRFRTLRALQVSHWEVAQNGQPDQGTSTPNGARVEWAVNLTIRVCFVVTVCTPDVVRVDSRWVERDGKAYLAKLDASGANQNGPRPWEVADLKVAVGKRAVVATTARYASRLTSLLAEAEKAATVADRFAIVGQPTRYLIYFAGSGEWKQWYGGSRPTWAAGYAVPTSAVTIDVVLNAAQTPTSFLDDILRHELTHVASLRGARRQDAEDWWLLEGLAEHAELSGRPVSQHDAVAAGAVRRFVRGGKWDGKVAVSEPADGAALADAGARYGLAFLAVRRLVDRFGEAKVLAFFEAVVHRGTAIDPAVRQAFGVPWTSVEADCVSFIRRTAG